ncbi:hypothetical protein R1flu_028704 [Riccia fluitans]|uniref:non-specific serine/threonine protein kinase n=1 Tax=Riccia fluitans TaxID=41844 RepID=A0ABD1XMG6_9MARC
MILVVLTTIFALTWSWWSILGTRGQGFPFTLNFQQFDGSQSSMFSFEGQARVDSVSRTLQLSDPSDESCQTNPCVGQVSFPQPVQVQDPVTNKTYSFSTSFTFTLTSPMRYRTGDGFVFFLATDPQPFPAADGTFGCFSPNNSGVSATPILAVEFDTSRNRHLNDMNDNHVGADINYAHSIRVADAGSVNITLSNGLLITSWIDYHHLYKLLEVRLSYTEGGAAKPTTPLLALPVDLSITWPPKMFVGFSTQVYHGAEQQCRIFSWSFRSFVETVLPPPPPLVPPSEKNNTSSTWAQKTVELGKLIGVAIGAFLLVALVCGASVGYARFGCSVATDPTDLLDPRESLLIDPKMQDEEGDDLEVNISGNNGTSVSDTTRASNCHPLRFRDVMFGNVMYCTTTVERSRDSISETGNIDSKEIVEVVADDSKRVEVEIVTGIDTTRAPLQQQVALLMERTISSIEDPTEAPRLTYRDLNEATDNFNESLELGEGRYGVFYGGILTNSIQIAVKRLTPLMKQKTEKFKAEASRLYRLQHPNLVRLLGWCKKGQEYFVVYHLISRGSLGRVIFHKGTLAWPERFKIIQNIADALEYLHERDTLHKNVKTSNIFLASDYDGKLGDFGLAWLMDHDEEKGTKGYVAPEVRSTHKLTKQTDVFSFGIVCLEILCERPSYDPDTDPEGQYLVNMVSDLVRNGTLRFAVSKDVNNTQEESDDPLMTLVAHLSLLCCDRDPNGRPAMKQVVQCLAGDIPFPPPPESVHPASSDRKNSSFIVTSTSKRELSATPDSVTVTTPSKKIITATASRKSLGLRTLSESPSNGTIAPTVTTSNDTTSDTIVVTGLQKIAGLSSSPLESNASTARAPRLARSSSVKDDDNVDSTLEERTTLADSSLEAEVDVRSPRNHSIRTMKHKELEEALQPSNEVQSPRGTPASRVPTTYNYCFSLLEELVSILLKYVEDKDHDVDDDDKLLDSGAPRKKNEIRSPSENPPGPPFRPPPDPPFRPPPIPPPRPPHRPRPSPSPSPIPEPDRPFPFPGPIPHRPHPLNPRPPRGPPQPPPPQGPEVLDKELERKNKVVKLETPHESVVAPGPSTQTYFRKKAVPKSEEENETISQQRIAHQDQKPVAYDTQNITEGDKTSSVKKTMKRVKPIEKSTTKSGSRSSQSIGLQTRFEGSHLKLQKTSKNTLPTPTSDLVNAKNPSTTPTKKAQKTTAGTARSRDTFTETGTSPPSGSKLEPRTSLPNPPSRRILTKESAPSRKMRNQTQIEPTREQLGTLPASSSSGTSESKGYTEGGSSSSFSRPKVQSRRHAHLPSPPSSPSQLSPRAPGKNLYVSNSLTLTTSPTQSLAIKDKLKFTDGVMISSTPGSSAISPREANPTVIHPELSLLPPSVADSNSTIPLLSTSRKKWSVPKSITDKPTGVDSFSKKSITSSSSRATPSARAEVESRANQQKLGSRPKINRPVFSPSAKPSYHPGALPPPDPIWELTSHPSGGNTSIVVPAPDQTVSPRSSERSSGTASSTPPKQRPPSPDMMKASRNKNPPTSRASTSRR